MPLFIWVFVRLGRALIATFHLVTDRQVMRKLPWRYIRTLPKSNPWIGLATLCLFGSITATLAGFVFRGALGFALALALVGVGSSAIRAVLRSPRYRR